MSSSTERRPFRPTGDGSADPAGTPSRLRKVALRPGFFLSEAKKIHINTHMSSTQESAAASAAPVPPSLSARLTSEVSVRLAEKSGTVRERLIEDEVAAQLVLRAQDASAVFTNLKKAHQDLRKIKPSAISYVASTTGAPAVRHAAFTEAEFKLQEKLTEWIGFAEASLAAAFDENNWEKLKKYVQPFNSGGGKPDAAPASKSGAGDGSAAQA